MISMRTNLLTVIGDPRQSDNPSHSLAFVRRSRRKISPSGRNDKSVRFRRSLCSNLSAGNEGSLFQCPTNRDLSPRVARPYTAINFYRSLSFPGRAPIDQNSALKLRTRLFHGIVRKINSRLMKGCQRDRRKKKIYRWILYSSPFFLPKIYDHLSSSSSSAFAAFKAALSNPSVTQP